MFMSFTRAVERLHREPVERWWEIIDDCRPLPRRTAVLGGVEYTVSYMPSISLEQWRNSGWADRPHP